MQRDLKALRRLIARALAAGAVRTGITRVEWDVAGDCQSPRTVELWSRPVRANPQQADWSWRRALAGGGFDPRIQLECLTEFGHSYADMVAAREAAFARFEPMPPSELKKVIVGPGHADHPMTLIVSCRCRKCPSCLELRRIEWTRRAKQEIAAAQRSWFGTITLRADEHYRLYCGGLAKARLRSSDVDKMTADEQFRLRLVAISPEITKYLKRIREESSASIRYLLVAEAHKSGLPHYHMLLHEKDSDSGVRKRILDAQWKLGFTQWRLIDPSPDKLHEATYLCKYLSKSAAARVRASQAYGKTDGSPGFVAPNLGNIDLPTPATVDESREVTVV